jgi:hypothetical protein
MDTFVTLAVDVSAVARSDDPGHDPTPGSDDGVLLEVGVDAALLAPVAGALVAGALAVEALPQPARASVMPRAPMSRRQDPRTVVTSAPVRWLPTTAWVTTLSRTDSDMGIFPIFIDQCLGE